MSTGWPGWPAYVALASDAGPAVVRRLATLASPSALVRATYKGVHGHPVLLGRDHWDGVVETARGDRGARDYLNSHDPVLVECGDLASGQDVDSPTTGFRLADTPSQAQA